jgi:hypothetical protein
MCVLLTGYPLEVHEVVTPDGYLLRMERIPQPTSTEAVFMMHGALTGLPGHVKQLLCAYIRCKPCRPANGFLHPPTQASLALRVHVDMATCARDTCSFVQPVCGLYLWSLLVPYGCIESLHIKPEPKHKECGVCGCVSVQVC